MSEYENLVQQQSGIQSQMNSAQDNNAVLQEQINRLEMAKSLIRPEKEQYSLVSWNYQNIAYGYYQWNGENYKHFSSDSLILLSESSMYGREIDDIEDGINWKITELKNRMSENDGFIGWCMSRLREIGTLLNNLCN